MSEFKTYGPENPCVLRQLARIRAEEKRRETAKAVFHGLLLAIFALALGVLAFTFAGACTL